MDNDRSIPRNAMLGPQRIPAAILLLLDILYFVGFLAYAQALPYVPMLWWARRIIQLALVAMLFIGRKDVGMLILLALQLALAVWSLVSSFSVAALLVAAVWAILCVAAAADVIQGFTLDISTLAGLAPLAAGLGLVRVALSFMSNLEGGGIFHAVLDSAFGLLWVLGIFYAAKALAHASPEASMPAQAGAPVYRTYSPPVHGQQAIPTPVAPEAGQADKKEP